MSQWKRSATVLMIWVACLATSHASSISSTAGQVDAFINMGSGPYAMDQPIALGQPAPWYESSQVDKLYGGVPTAQQQAAFSQTVLDRVEQTFQLSGISLTATTDPSVAAEHTLSVVSNATSSLYTGAIGETELGGNGFNFIDPTAASVQSVDQLEWLVAHNVSHELMLAFGVGEHYDQTGNYIDSTKANMSMMLNPNATFSPDAASALRATGSLQSTSSLLSSSSIFSNSSLLSPVSLLQVPSTPPSSAPQLVTPQPVPEPATVVSWLFAVTACVACGRKYKTRVSSAAKS